MKLIVDYARNYENLTNEQADALMSKAFELEAQRAILKKSMSLWAALRTRAAFCDWTRLSKRLGIPFG